MSERAIQQRNDEEGCGAFFAAAHFPQVQVTSDVDGDAAVTRTDWRGRRYSAEIPERLRQGTPAAITGRCPVSGDLFDDAEDDAVA